LILKTLWDFHVSKQILHKESLIPAFKNLIPRYRYRDFHSTTISHILILSLFPDEQMRGGSLGNFKYGVNLAGTFPVSH
jgi:hypothetical protein